MPLTAQRRHFTACVIIPGGDRGCVLMSTGVATVAEFNDLKAAPGGFQLDGFTKHTNQAFTALRHMQSIMCRIAWCDDQKFMTITPGPCGSRYVNAKKNPQCCEATEGQSNLQTKAGDQ